MEFVQSHYRSTWKGLVLNREKRKHEGKRIGDLLTVIVLVDRHGNRMKHRDVTTIDETWTKPIKPLDISWVNPDWLAPPSGELGWRCMGCLKAFAMPIDAAIVIKNGIPTTYCLKCSEGKEVVSL